MGSDWRRDLERWLTPFLAALGHKAWPVCAGLRCGAYRYRGAQERAALGAARRRLGYDQLHHFVSAGVWDAAPLEQELVRQADALLGGDEAFLIVDDTALPKKGRHSVGVAPQDASALGKNANCQTLVSLTLARDEVPAMLGLRLFLPESWTSDPTRLAKSGAPEPRRTYRTKPEIAIEEIDRLLAAGLGSGPINPRANVIQSPFRGGSDDWFVPAERNANGSDSSAFPAATRRAAGR